MASHKTTVLKELRRDLERIRQLIDDGDRGAALRELTKVVEELVDLLE